MAPLVERLTAVETAIVSTARRFSRERLIYTLIISFLVGLILVTILQVAYGPMLAPARSQPQANEVKSTPVNEATRAAAAPAVNNTQVAAAQSADAAQPTQPPAPDAAAVADAQKSGGGAAASDGYVVRVRMRVKNGQVTGARVLNSRPGASGYEAQALKLAMQHRYSDNFTGSDTLKITVER